MFPIACTHLDMSKLTRHETCINNIDVPAVSKEFNEVEDQIIDTDHNKDKNSVIII